ncbi:hypothetical protein A2U01_0018004, partial [Trifolium medium]|nr:hypothetical protein [Trifolium medium]
MSGSIVIDIAANGSVTTTMVCIYDSGTFPKPKESLNPKFMNAGEVETSLITSGRTLGRGDFVTWVSQGCERVVGGWEGVVSSNCGMGRLGEEG